MPLPMKSTAKRLGSGAGAAHALIDSSHGNASVTPAPRSTVRLEIFIASTPGIMHRRAMEKNADRRHFARVLPGEQLWCSLVHVTPPHHVYPAGGRNFTQTGD